METRCGGGDEPVIAPFGIAGPGRILFGRGEAAKAAALILGFGTRGILVHGASRARADWLIGGLSGAEVLCIPCAGEPVLADLEAALGAARGHRPAWIAALGGGSALDMGKALAALIPQEAGPMDHLEGVGPALPLHAAPLPFIAVPTTAGTGSEATKNAVIGLPHLGRKVSLRDDRMLARLAIVDPALTDGCPRGVTLASGLDAVTQVIEPYMSHRATPFTDALCRPAIGRGMAALMRLMAGEDQAARDDLAWVSLCGGLALANAGLGAVHGLAGVIGGQTGAAHGAICGALLGPVIAMNLRLVPEGGVMAGRLGEVCGILGAALGVPEQDAPAALGPWARAAGLPGLAAMGVRPGDHEEIAMAALGASSMKANPVQPGISDLVATMEAAA